VGAKAKLRSGRSLRGADIVPSAKEPADPAENRALSPRPAGGRPALECRIAFRASGVHKPDSMQRNGAFGVATGGVHEPSPPRRRRRRCGSLGVACADEIDLVETAHSDEHNTVAGDVTVCCAEPFRAFSRYRSQTKLGHRIKLRCRSFRYNGAGMRQAYRQVQHRNRRILRYLQHRPAAPTGISEALDIPIDSLSGP
jgi:hypothetical protein